MKMRTGLLRTFACFLAVVGPISLFADQPPAGLSLFYQMGSGSYYSDLEPRYRDDKTFGSLLAGGYGTNLDWESRGGFASGFGFEYRSPAHWLIQFDQSVLVTSPSYVGFLNVNSGGIALSQMEIVSIDPLTRTTGKIVGGVNIDVGPQASVDLLGGLRNQGERADYSIVRINQFTSPFTLTQTEISTDATTRGSAAGLCIGGALHVTLHKDFELVGGGFIYDMHGNASLDYTTIKFSSSGTAIALRHEDGDWRVSGVEWFGSLRYHFAQTWTLFGTLRRETSTVQDSSVINYNISSDASFGSTNSVIGFLLTYSGSAQRENVSRFEFGIEKRFDL